MTSGLVVVVRHRWDRWWWQWEYEDIIQRACLEPYSTEAEARSAGEKDLEEAEARVAREATTRDPSANPVWLTVEAARRNVEERRAGQRASMKVTP